MTPPRLRCPPCPPPANVQDERVVVIRDRRPAAAQHLLVLPRAHIPNVSSLGPADVGLGVVELLLVMQRA